MQAKAQSIIPLESSQIPPYIMPKASAPILEISGLCARFNAFSLKNICFEIHPFERLGIIGESGSGKSLLAKLILGLVRPTQSPSGKIYFCGNDLLTLKEHHLTKIRGAQIAYIPQSPLLALNPLHTIQKQMLEMFALHCPKLPRDEQNRQIKSALMRVGLDFSIAERLPHTLSGGQAQRVCIAMMSLLRPKILLCDEPTTALDAHIQKQILELLQSFEDMAIVFISHDLGLMRHFATRILVMQEGSIVDRGTQEEIFQREIVLDSSTQDSIASKRALDSTQDSRPKPPTRNPYTKLLLESTYLTPNTLSAIDPTLLTLRDFGVFYTKKGIFRTHKLKALEHLNLTLKSCDSIGIIGESGSGKSSLALGILGLEEHIGELILADSVLAQTTPKTALKTSSQTTPQTIYPSKKRDMAFKHSIQIVFQDPFLALNPRMCVFEILCEALQIHDPAKTSRQLETKAANYLYQVGLDERFLYRYPHTLSGGQAQRVCIARALATRAHILILDEPTSALDKTAQKAILTLLQNLQRDLHLSYLMISHDLEVIEAMCQQVLVLKNGKVLEYGSVKEVFNTPKSPYTKLLLESKTL